MKKGIFAVIFIFFAGLTLTSCEKCMICEVNYTKENGERVMESSPQKCGFPWELDDKEKQLKEAYSYYDSVDVDCNRER